MPISIVSHRCLALSVDDLLKLAQRDKFPQSQLGLPCALKLPQSGHAGRWCVHVQRQLMLSAC